MEIRLGQILFQVLNFAIILFVLKKFLYKPVLKVLDDRANRIKDGLEAAEKNVKLHEDLETKQDKIIKKAQIEADALVQQAKTEADQIVRQAQEKAKSEVKQVLQTERQAWQNQMSEQTQKFQKNLTDVVTSSVETVLQDLVSLKVDKTIVDKQISKLDLKHII